MLTVVVVVVRKRTSNNNNGCILTAEAAAVGRLLLLPLLHLLRPIVIIADVRSLLSLPFADLPQYTTTSLVLLLTAVVVCWPSKYKHCNKKQTKQTSKQRCVL